jgi:hypothetical protein
MTILYVGYHNTKKLNCLNQLVVKLKKLQKI